MTRANQPLAGKGSSQGKQTRNWRTGIGITSISCQEPRGELSNSSKGKRRNEEMKKSGTISSGGVPSCELCGGQARMYCESDRASLCWDCDDKVHDANFLVAKHTRTALCGQCRSRTPWKAAGQNLGRTVSVCDRCCGGRLSASAARVRDEGVGGWDEEDTNIIARSPLAEVSDVERRDGRPREVDCEFDDDSDEDVDGDEGNSCSDYEEQDDDDDENQVVPLTSPATAAGSTSSSGEEEQSYGGRPTAIKRTCDFAFLQSDDDDEEDESKACTMGRRCRDQCLQGGMKRRRLGS